jgi:large repetitive protein
VPDADFYGTDLFTFRASDGEATSGLATVSLTVIAQNDPPRFGNFPATLNVLKQSVFDVVVPVSDVDSSSWTFSLSNGAPKWATIDAQSGVLSLRPDLDARDVAFDVVVTDKEGASARHAVGVAVFSAGVRSGHLFVFGTSGSR